MASKRLAKTTVRSGLAALVHRQGKVNIVGILVSQLDFVYIGPSNVICQGGVVMAERLNATAGALLGLLRAGARSGYDLVAEANKVIGAFWTITRSQVYRELADLAERGLVERTEPGPRDRQPFRITSSGRTAFRDWVNTPPEPENLRIPLLIRLTFADEIDRDQLRQMLSEHRGIHARRLEDYRELDRQLAEGGVPPEQRVTLAFGISYESAVLRWFDQLPESLADPGEGPSRHVTRRRAETGTL